MKPLPGRYTTLHRSEMIARMMPGLFQRDAELPEKAAEEDEKKKRKPPKTKKS